MRFGPLAGGLPALLLAASPCLAQAAPPIQVNPNRPTFATPALTTQEGVAELELGLQHSILREGALSSTPFLLKLGVLEHLELRIGGNGLLHSSDPGEPSHTGYGDTTLGAQWTYLPHGPLGVDEAVQLTFKVPTASAEEDLGSGEADVLLMLLLSRDVGAFHGDVNLLTAWLGRGVRRTREAEPAGTVSVSCTLGPHWSLTGELYSIAGTTLSPSIVSNLWAVDYKVSTRLVLDSGVDVGLSHGAQKVSLFAGFTWGAGRFRRPGRV
jgi:hypothetical protein